MGAHDDPQPHEPKRTIKLEVPEDSPDTTRVLPEPPRDDYRVISSEPHDLEGADETTTLLSAPEINQQTRVLNESSDVPRPHSETPEPTGAPVANLANQKPQRHVLEPTSVSKLRYALAILAASLSILCALTGSVASWVNQNLISQSGFNQLSTQLVEDQDFQKRIADAAVTDVMNSDAVKRVFPESGNNFLTQILSTSRGEVKKRLSENAQRLTGTSEYRTMWRQVAADTHTYNLAHPDDPAALDISAFYRELDARVGSIGIYDPDISSWGKHLISIDRDGNPVQHAVQRAQWVGSMSGVLDSCGGSMDSECGHGAANPADTWAQYRQHGGNCFLRRPSEYGAPHADGSSEFARKLQCMGGRGLASGRYSCQTHCAHCERHHSTHTLEEQTT